MTVSPPENDRKRLTRARRAFVWFGIVLPLAMTVAAVAIQLWLLPRVPDPVAVHWAVSGAPDGYAAPWTVPALSAGLGIGMTLVLSAFALLGSREGEWGATIRFLGSLAPAVVGAVMVVITGTYAAQVDLPVATQSAGIFGPLVWSGATGIVVGVVAWVSQPRLTVSGGTVRPATPVLLGPGERAVWVRTASLASGGMAVLVGAAVLLFALAALDIATAGSAWPILLIVAVVVTAAILATMLFRVRVDHDGLSVTSLLGVPRFRVSLDQVVEVKVVTINPMADFGGWGLRKALDGRTGVVLRRGEALEVERARGGAFVVTVDDASTAAGLLLALRERGERGEGGDHGGAA